MPPARRSATLRRCRAGEAGLRTAGMETGAGPLLHRNPRCRRQPQVTLLLDPQARGHGAAGRRRLQQASPIPYAPGGSARRHPTLLSDRRRERDRRANRARPPQRIRSGAGLQPGSGSFGGRRGNPGHRAGTKDGGSRSRVPSPTAPQPGTAGGSTRPTGSGSTERCTPSVSTDGITGGDLRDRRFVTLRYARVGALPQSLAGPSLTVPRGDPQLSSGRGPRWVPRFPTPRGAGRSPHQGLGLLVQTYARRWL